MLQMIDQAGDIHVTVGLKCNQKIPENWYTPVTGNMHLSTLEHIEAWKHGMHFTNIISMAQCKTAETPVC